MPKPPDLPTRLATHAANLDRRVVRNKSRGPVPQVPDNEEAVMEAVAEMLRSNVELHRAVEELLRK